MGKTAEASALHYNMVPQAAVSRVCYSCGPNGHWQPSSARLILVYTSHVDLPWLHHARGKGRTPTTCQPPQHQQRAAKPPPQQAHIKADQWQEPDLVYNPHPWTGHVRTSDGISSGLVCPGIYILPARKPSVNGPYEWQRRPPSANHRPHAHQRRCRLAAARWYWRLSPSVRRC